MKCSIVFGNAVYCCGLESSTLDSLLAELEVQCDPVEEEVAEEVVEIEDLGEMVVQIEDCEREIC